MCSSYCTGAWGRGQCYCCIEICMSKPKSIGYIFLDILTIKINCKLPCPCASVNKMGSCQVIGGGNNNIQSCMSVIIVSLEC